MWSAWRGLARGRNLLIGLTVVALIGSAAALFRVYDGNKPANIITEGLSEQQLSTPVDDAREVIPVATLSDVLERRRDELERDPNAPVLGNPHGDVTVIEFFDYNCPYCKRVGDDIKTLLGEDQGIRLVYREWPILGRDSLFAARAALAARRQGKYEEFHIALMAQPRVSEQLILRIARKIGLDIPRLLNDMNHRSVSQHIALSMDLSRSLGINGTPSFVIGEKVARGLIPLDQLRDYVRAARAGRAQK